MHGESLNADKEQLSAEELHGFVGWTLEVAGALTG